MQSIVNSLGRARPIVVLALGIALGGSAVVFARPPSTEAVTTYTRGWSCQGRDFMPLTSSQPFGYENAMRRGQGYFQCDADIPHKAIVTKVRFTLYDNFIEEVNQCALVRISLAATTAGAPDIMASVPGTGSGTGTAGGNFRLATSTISNATIDRLNYAYYLQCFIQVDIYSLGIWGADVTYKITAANG